MPRHLAIRLGRTLKTQRYWVEMGVLGGTVLLLALGVGGAAHRRAAALERQSAELLRLVASGDRWAADFRPVAPSESVAWARTQTRVRQLGIPSAERIRLAQAVALAAEERGLAKVRVAFVVPDSAGAPLRTAGGAATFRVAPYGLAVEFEGAYRAAVALIGALPPAVAVRRVEMRRDGERTTTRFTLLVYEPVETNDAGQTTAAGANLGGGNLAAADGGGSAPPERPGADTLRDR